MHDTHGLSVDKQFGVCPHTQQQIRLVKSYYSFKRSAIAFVADSGKATTLAFARIAKCTVELIDGIRVVCNERESGVYVTEAKKLTCALLAELNGEFRKYARSSQGGGSAQYRQQKRSKKHGPSDALNFDVNNANYAKGVLS